MMTRKQVCLRFLYAFDTVFSFLLSYIATIIVSNATENDIECEDLMIFWLYIFGISRFIRGVFVMCHLLHYDNRSEKIKGIVDKFEIVHYTLMVTWNMAGSYLAFNEKKSALLESCNRILHSKLQDMVHVDAAWICIMLFFVCILNN